MRVDLPTGINPVAAQVADLNGDGHPDIVVANDGSSTVSVLLGNGAGVFATHVDFATGANPASVAVGDLNGDGKPDIVTANSSGNSISVLLGNGAGSFGAKTDFPTAAHPECVVIADVNGDGYPDLVVANWGANSVSVMLGNGTGSFASRTDYTAGTNPYTVAVGDVNGDGNLDIVTVNEGSNSVSVLLGDGAGSFGAKTDFATGGSPISVALSDLNNDGILDIATANYGSGVNTVSVMLGNGTGGFGPRTDLATPAGPGWVTIADADGDGKADLVVAEYAAGDISEFPGDGAGGFGARVDIATGTSSSTVVVADVNGDGNPDLVMPDYNTASATVLLGNGKGQFEANTDYTIGSGSQSVAIGDLNGDGRPDLVTANGVAGSVSVLLGIGAGRFGAQMEIPAGSGPSSVAIGDLNGDGYPDLAVADYYSDSVLVMFGNGTGSFTSRTEFPTGSFPNSVAIGDVNGDHKPDLVVANYGSNTVSVLLGDGLGGFGAKTDFPTASYPKSVAIGDLNSDGKPDLAVANYGFGSVSVMLGDGTGAFGARTDYAVGGFAPYSVAIGDLNGDGKPDLVTAAGGPGSNTVSVLFGDGTGSFGSAFNFSSGTVPISAAIGDVNGDGRADIATASAGASSASVLLGNGGGSFGTATDYATGTSPYWVVLGDLDGDGRPDLVTANGHATTVSVLLGLEPTRTTLAVSRNPVQWQSPVTLTASVTVPAPGYRTPSGSVRFFDGTTLLGTAPVSGGAASLSMFATRQGPRVLTAVYEGDSRMFGSISSPVQLQVNSLVHLAINFDFDPLGVAIPNGANVDSTYLAWGVTFDKVGPGTSCGSGPQVYANTTSRPVGFGSLPNLVSVCPPPTSADFSQNSFGMVHAMFTSPVFSVCINVHPDSPSDFAVLQLFDASDNMLGSTTSAPGVTGPLCLNGIGVRGARFAGSGAHFATFDDLTLSFVTDRVDFDHTPAGITIPAGSIVNTLYSGLGVTFEKSNLSAGCGFGSNVYANSDQPSGFGSAPNVVSLCPPPQASDMSENGVGEVYANFAEPYSRVCIDVRPDGPADSGVLRAYDALDTLIAQITSVPGATQQLCVDAPGIRGVRFSGSGSHLARFDNLVFGGASVASAPAPPIPTALELSSPYPNPTRGGISVRFSLPSAGSATLTLFDVAGRVIESREVGELGPGRHVITFEASRGIAPGVYLMKLRRGGESRTATAILLR